MRRELHKALTIAACLVLLCIAGCGSSDDHVQANDPPPKEAGDVTAKEATEGLYRVDRYESPQAAIDAAAAAGGGTVVFGPRTYDVDQTLTVNHPNVRIRGEGRVTVLKPKRNLQPMIFVGADSGPFLPYSGNEIEGLLVDFAGTDSTAIQWRRWGQIGRATDVHFLNPGPEATGIVTGSNRQANELVFEGINWWHDIESGKEPAYRGTAIRIDANNCKVLNSTIIGAAVGVDVATSNAISEFSLSGCRLKQNGIAVRLGGGATRGGFAANVSDSRFEKNHLWDIHAAGLSTEFGWDGIFLRGLFFSHSAGIHLQNTSGVALDTLVVKDFTDESTSGRGVFVVDGSPSGETTNFQFHARNLVRSQGTTIARLIDQRLGNDGSERMSARLHVGAGTDVEPGAVSIYVTEPGTAAVAARNTQSRVEMRMSAAEGTGKVGTTTAHDVEIAAGNRVKLRLAGEGPVTLEDGVLALRPSQSPPAATDIPQLYFDAGRGRLAVVLPDGTIHPVGEASE